VFAGQFTHVDGIPRNGLARLNANGTLDTGWNPDPDGTVLTLAADPAGNVYVGGDFTQIAGATRNGLSRFTANGDTLDAVWDPALDNQISATNAGTASVRAMALDGAGSLYIAGFLPARRRHRAQGSRQGQHQRQRRRGRRLESVAGRPGRVDLHRWRERVHRRQLHYCRRSVPMGARKARGRRSGQRGRRLESQSEPAQPVLQSQHLVHPHGARGRRGVRLCRRLFLRDRRRQYLHLAKVSATGTGAPVPGWRADANYQIGTLALHNGDLYVAGEYQMIRGVPRNGLSRHDLTTGAVDTSWDPATDDVVGGDLLYADISKVRTMAFDGAGNVILGGTFTRAGGQTKTSIASVTLSGSGTANPAWSSAMSPGNVRSIVRDGTGGTIIGGEFTFMGDGTTIRNRLARLDAAGNLDPAWKPEALATVETLALDGANLYVGGRFKTIGGLSRSRIARISATGNGDVDPVWNPNANGTVAALAIDGPGSAVYAAGEFTTIGGASRNALAKISTTGAGGVDPLWNPNVTPWRHQTLNALAWDGAGSLFVGGNFLDMGGQSRRSLAKLSGSGTGAADPAWNPSPLKSNGGIYTLVHALALDGTGNLYAGGVFDNIGGQPRNALARLSTTGTGAADAWNPNVGYSVEAIALDNASHVYIGGSIHDVGGAKRRNIARLPTSGTVTAECTWIAEADDVVAALAVDNAGNAYAGGTFRNIAGVARYGYAVLAPAPATGCQIAFVEINFNLPPSASIAFPVTVEARDRNGNPQPVTANTTIALSVATGTGTLSGSLSCQIAAGATQCTMPGVIYSQAENGVVFTASRTAGDPLATANTAPLNIIAEPPPTRLAFIDINGGVNPTAGVPFNVTIQARDAGGAPRTVAGITSVAIIQTTGTGQFTNFTFSLSYPGCSIPAGASQCSTSLTYSKPETGVIATAQMTYLGNSIAANSQPFDVLAGPHRTLTVHAPTASVTSSPAGINCSSTRTCSATFALGTPITLTYNGTAGTLVAWKGGCTGNATTCAFMLNDDATVAVDYLNSCTGIGCGSSTSGIESTINIAGSTTRRVDQTATRIIARWQGSTVYDQTFIAAYADSSTQAGIAAAAGAIRQAAGTASVGVDPPVAVGTSDVVLGTALTFDDVVTFTLVSPPLSNRSGMTFPVGNVGICVTAPTNCPPPLTQVTASGITYSNFITRLILQTSRTNVTTETHRITTTYALGDALIGSNADLLSLVPSTGVLAPTFDSAGFVYSNLVPAATMSTTLTPTPVDSAATITVNGVPVAGGTASQAITLTGTTTPVTIVVTAQDGITTRTYTVAITKQATLACLATPAGLVSWWPGDGNPNDIRGNNSGTVQGGATFVPAKVGQGFSFTGADHISVADANNLDLTTGATLAAWINPTSCNRPLCSIVAKSDVGGSGRAYGLWMTGPGAPNGAPAGALYVEASGGGAYAYTSAASVPLNAPTHVAATLSPGDGFALYINGQAQAMTVAGSPVLVANASPLKIGTSDVDAFFTGVVDEVQVFNRPLAASELAAIVGVGTLGQCKALLDIDADGRTDALTDGLMVLRRLFGLTGTTVTDSAVSAGATRTLVADILTYIAELGNALDVDANGKLDALTDGLMIIRHLFGLRNDALINSAIGNNAMRTDATAIDIYIQGLR
jgi:hypothetical protein